MVCRFWCLSSNMLWHMCIIKQAGVQLQTKVVYTYLLSTITYGKKCSLRRTSICIYLIHSITSYLSLSVSFSHSVGALFLNFLNIWSSLRARIVYKSIKQWKVRFSFYSKRQIVGWIILRGILERWDGVIWTGLVWLKIGTGGKLLWIRYWTYGFHEMPGNYRVA
jgi:hypothetical protein